MKSRFFLLLLLFLCKSSFANVAVDELHDLLAQKEKKERLFKESDSRLRELQDNYTFVFIFRSTCPHCQQFAPILKDFAAHFKVELESYSIDGKSLPDLEGTPLTPQLFQTFYVQGQFQPVVPALFLVNRHTLEAYAVLFGEATPYQLVLRIEELLKHIEEKFHE